MRTTGDNVNVVMSTISVVIGRHGSIIKELGEYPEFACAHTQVMSGTTLKDAIEIDKRIEREAQIEFKKILNENVYVIGEESLPSTGLPSKPEGTLIALVDMIDGTDLLELTIPMWCSAVVIFDPKEPRIVCSVVGLATGEVYFAYDGDPGAYVIRPTGNLQKDWSEKKKVEGPSSVKELKNATISFYGQKASSLYSVMSNEGLMNAFKFILENNESNFRIHTLAGNPIMVKLIDRRRCDNGEIIGKGFDAVFDIDGQKLHDVVPGAYIALKAGAHLSDLDGTEISEENLADFLLSPTERIKYVLAATPELMDEMVSILNVSELVIA